MRRGSDTQIAIDAPELEVDVVDKVFISLKQKGLVITKEATLKDGKAIIDLTGKETSKFAPGKMWMQIMAQAKDNKVIQSEVIKHHIEDSLGGEADESGYGYYIRYSN